MSQSNNLAIIINGPSSSGKTSVAKALQRKIGAPLLHFQLDMFWNMVPDHIEANSKNFPDMKDVLINTAQDLMSRHYSIVMDIVGNSENIDKLKDALGNYKVYTVGLTARLDILQTREIERQNRKTGLAESQLSGFHENISYDFFADSSDVSSEEIADNILQDIKKRFSFTAAQDFPDPEL